MSTVAANSLVIMLHGVGSSGNALAPLFNAWKTSLPGAIFVSPNAPDASSFGSGYQWFSVAGVTEGNRSERIADARPSFDRVITSLIEENGFAGKLKRVAFVGFSQGTIMALDAVASGRWPVAGVVGFSGRLASPLPLQPALETPILLVHGSADPVIPATETTKAAATLRGLGLKVETLMLPGVPHTISAEGAAKGGDFLEETFAE